MRKKREKTRSLRLVNLNVQKISIIQQVGPLLFSLFVNDLPSIAKNPLVLFADDAKFIVLFNLMRTSYEILQHCRILTVC